jgi:predicted ATPase/DNA-binding SARP family transcriptional activator
MASTDGGLLPAVGDGGALQRARLRLLGAVELDGPVSLRFLPERRFRLLAYLALNQTWVARDQLAHLFWPDRTQEAARNNLRKLLLEVRALGVPALDDSRHSIRWQVDHDAADLAKAHAQNDHRSVLNLYRGTPLHGLDGGDSPAFAAWLRSERLRLRTMWRESVLATVRDVAPQTAVDLSQRLLDDEPYDEDAVRMQMRAFAALGRTADVARTYRTFAERVTEELGVDVAIETRNLARELQLDKPLAQTGTLAVASTECSDGFIGRGAELAELQALLADPQCRLITVTGPGGMGKSRLVKELIHRRSSCAAETICWIALDDLTDVAQVAPRVANELGLVTTALQNPIEVVAGHLVPLNGLLVFDNSEHLPSLGELVNNWLARAPRLKILVTSRARIGVRSEWLMSLRGLEVPAADNGDAVLQSDAARLFVSQAQLAQPRFNPSGHLGSVASLMRAVGGMPLAILLAASWVRVLSVADMVSDLTHLLDVLEQAEEGDERPEHRSVRATLEQSWRLLSPAQHHLLMTLSVFAGTSARTTVQDVSQAPLPVLGSLIDKSLVQIDNDGRCSLHPLVQQFAAQKLAECPASLKAARESHATFFTRLMKQFEDFNSIDQTEALRVISAELPNVLAAWEWAIAERRVDVLGHCASGLSNYFQARGPIRTGLELFSRAEDALKGAQQASSRAAWSIPLELAALHYWLGNSGAMEAAGRRALAASRAQNSKFAIRASLNVLGLALLRQDRLVDAERCLSEALKRARAEQLLSEVASFAGNLVGIKRELGDDESALALAMEALDGHRRNGHRMGEVSMHNEIGLLLHAGGRPDAAIRSYERGMQVAQAAGLVSRRGALLSNGASALLDSGDLTRARQFSMEALSVALATGLAASLPSYHCQLSAVELAAGNFDCARDQLTRAIAASREVSSAHALAHVLREGANYVEQQGDTAVALRLIICADTHHNSRAALTRRYRDTADRLRQKLGPAAVAAAEAVGAALSLDAGLDELARALGRHG